MGPFEEGHDISVLPVINSMRKVGGAGGGVTVSVNGELALAKPSLTETVMRAEPDWPAAGVMNKARFVPLPPSTMLALGTKAVLPDEAVTMRLPGGVSTSLTSKRIGGVGVLAGVDRLAMGLIVTSIAINAWGVLWGRILGW